MSERAALAPREFALERSTLDCAVSVSALDGGAQASFPVQVTEGREGFHPTLAFAYAGSRANSPYGVGWSLSGAEAVTRDTSWRLPQYRDGEDRFHLAGSEIVPLIDGGARVTRAEGGFTVERWRARTERLFERIEKWTENATGRVHWRRFARDGTLSIYGLAADGSTRIADPADPSRVSEWLVERRHSPRGDVMAFRYKAEDTAGVDPAEPVERHRLDPAAQPMRYLKAIRYGATVPWDGFGPQPAGLDYLFEVILDYGEHGAAGGLPDPTEGVSWPVRPDAYSSYRRGFEVRTRRLCRRVLMVHRLAELPGPTVVSATELDHTDRPEGAVLTAARRIGYRPAAGGGVPVSRATPDVSFGYGEASLGGGFASAPQVAEGGLMGAIERRAHLFVDLKGEGLPGLLTRDRDAWLWRENLGGGRFAPARPLPSAPKVAALAMSVGDGDGDGRTSVDTVIGREAGGWRYDGGGPEPGWQPHRTLAAQARADTGTARVQFADLNGDGYPDLLIDRGESFDWFPAKGSDGFAPARSLPKPVDEFGAPVGTGSAATGHFWGDMTGDGLADLVRISAGRVEVWPNLGQGRFGRSFVMDDAPRLPDALPPGRLILADADLDGRADILIVGEGEITLWRNLSGNRFAPPEVLRGLPVIDTASQLQVLDLMGDGRPCLVWASQVPGRADAPLQYLPLTTAIRPGLLERVETGTGLTHRIDWGWSGEDYTSARAAGEPWATLLPRHRPIVRALRAEDAVTGATRATLYRFADGGFDHDERRFTGFGRCETLDQDTGIGGDPAAPPRLTRVWSHLGAAQPAALAGRWSGDPAASPPPWAAVEDEAALATRDYDEASRAVAGLLLRREVYGCAPDGTPDADPISVHVSGYRIAPLQPSLSTVTRAAFAPVQAETLTWLYEDSRDDPRVTHTVRLARSATGGEERVAEFSYARRPGPGRLPEQSVAHGSVRVRRQRGIDRDRAYQPDVLLETQRHHISGLGARHEPFTHAEADATVQAALAAPAPFGSAPPPGLHATLIAAQRMRYWTEARDGIAAEAALPDHPLLHSTRSAVMPTARFQAAFGTLGALPALLAETGLVDDAGMVWTPSAVSHYRDRADFNRLERTVTPDGAETRLAWRADGLAPLSITGEDGAISSGVLDPFTAEIARTTDPNGTIVETAYDPLGQPVRHTMRGQQRDAGGALHPVGGDPLPGGPDPDGGLDLTGALVDPEAALGTQSGAVFYDLSSRPVRRLDLTREEHADDGAGGRIANARVAVALTYIDGFGTTLQTRVRGGAGPAISRDGGGAILVTPEGTLLMADAPLRWLVSGFEHRSANGLPLELFEPFFSPVPDYEDDEALRRNGVSRRNTYDAMGRVLRVDHPDGSVERSEWYAWHQIDHDRNDAVTGTAYEATRSGLSPSHPERIALEQARRHAGTPTRTDIGSAGEIAIITETAEGGASRQTRTTLSVPEGRDVMTDPRGLSTVRQADMAGRAWRTQSPDAGAVLTLRRWDGSVSRSLDARGVLVLTRYDTLSRPIETEVIEGAAPARITERIAYGPADAATAERNLVGRVASIEDEAGLWTALRAAPSGDLLEETRRFRANHRAVVDLAAPPPLDPETHRTIRLFDALGRVTEFTAADGSVTRTTHGPFGEAERVGVTTADGVLSDREIASGFTHDARGRLVSGLIGGVVALARTYQRTTPRPETITATGPGGRLLQDLRLAFDPVGNPVMSEDAAQAPGAAGSPVTGLAVSARRLFTHDAYYRLASASGRVHRALQIQDYRNGLDDGAATKSTRHITLDNGAEIDAYTRTYTYDDGDNLTRIHHAGDTLTWTRDIWVSATSNRSLPAVDLNGIALVAPEAAFDAGGNVTRMPHLEAMEWNWQGRLARAVIIGRGGPGLDDAEVSVYGTGRQRLRRIVERRVGGAMELAETIFLPGCTLRRVRREGEAPTLARSTLEVEASGLTVARIHQWTADATGRETDSIAEKRIRLLLHDHLGSVSTELDETGGVATYEEYFAFGGTAFIAGRDRRDVTIKENRFAGGLRDDATGFYCFEHRHYAPFIGNWISPDPAGTVDGLNLYRYARNNPVLFVDPSGLESIVNWPDETPRAVRQAAFDPSDTARATFTAFVDTITVEINGQTWSTTATVTARRNERGDFVRWWATFELEAPVAPPDESGGANQQGGGQQSGQGQQPARPPQRDDDEADGPGGSGGTGTDGDGPGAGEDGTGTGADGDDDETTPGQPGTGEGNREGPGRGDGETGDTTGQDGTGNTPGQNGTGDTPGQGGDGETPGQNGTGDEPGTGGSGEGGGGTGQRSSAERRSEEAPSPPEGYPTSEDGVPYSPDLDLPPPEEIPPDAEFTTDPNAVSPGRGADSQGDPRGTPEGEAPNTRPGGQGGQGGPEGSASGQGAGAPGSNGSSDGDPRNSEGKRGLKGGMGTHELPEWLGWVDPALDWVQTGLDIVGLIPGLGEIADGINGLISLARGDYLGASLSFAAMIPFAGWAATAGKFGRRAVNAADAMSDAGGAILRHGDEAAEAAAAARRRAAGLPDDDPLIDNNILSWLHSGQSQAVDFAERYRGLVSIDRTVAREFMRGGRSAHELHGLMRRFDITLLPRVDAATLAPDLAHVLASRGGTVARNDDVIVATARHFGLRFASGDQRAVISALRSGVDARYFNFGPYSIRQRYGRMITRLRGNGFNPRDVLGPLNPWP